MFAANWNRRFLQVADRECAYHTFNQLNKWSVLIKWLQTSKWADALGFLDEVAFPKEKLTLGAWYEEALGSKHAGIKIPLKSVPDAETDTLQAIPSGRLAIGGRRGFFFGGIDGPSGDQIRAAELLSTNPELRVAARQYDRLTLAELLQLKERIDGLANSALLDMKGEGAATAFALKGGGVEVTRGQLIAWSNTGAPLPDGFLEGLKRQPVVVEGLPAASFHEESQLGKALRKLQGAGVQITFKLSDTQAGAMPARMKGLMTWTQIDFEAESAQIDKVTNRQVADFAIDYLRSKVLPGREGEARQVVRVIVDHAEGKLTIRELIDRANAGHYRHRHVILGVCNDNPADVVAFCKAAYANGCRSVVIPSGKVSIPVVLLTAESLNSNSLLRRGSIPQVAWRRAEADVVGKLRKVVEESGGDDAKAVELLDRVVPGFKASPMFLGDRGATKGVLDRIKQFLGDAERNSWNQTTSRPLSQSEATRVAA